MDGRTLLAMEKDDPFWEDLDLNNKDLEIVKKRL